MKFVKKLLLSKKSLYFTLIAFGALTSIYFWVQTARICWVNYFLNEQCPAKVDRWEVREAGSDRYVLTAHFSFEAGGRLFHGKTRFDQPVWINPDSAIQALKEKAARTESWSVWFDRGDPTRSSLQKRSLRGLMFRAALCSAVLIHFVLLRKKIFIGNKVPVNIPE